VTVRETVDARKHRYDAAALPALFKSADRVIISKGAKSITLTPKTSSSADLAPALGPSGNLRAPTARIGKTYLVGFNEDTWRDALK
jgi:hypothetical protein